MAQHDTTQHDSSGHAHAESTPAVHSPTVPAESGPTRAAPVVYSDWLDEDVEFDILPAPLSGTLHARFELLGKASPTPYDFDE